MQYFEPFLNFVDSLQTENVESRVVEQKYDTLYEIDLFVPISGHEKLKTEMYFAKERYNFFTYEAVVKMQNLPENLDDKTKYRLFKKINYINQYSRFYSAKISDDHNCITGGIRLVLPLDFNPGFIFIYWKQSISAFVDAYRNISLILSGEY